MELTNLDEIGLAIDLCVIFNLGNDTVQIGMGEANESFHEIVTAITSSCKLYVQWSSMIAIRPVVGLEVKIRSPPSWRTSGL
jgi:hypothetical protein